MAITLKDKLKNKIPEKFLDKVNRSYELVGDIALIEINEETEKFEKIICEELMNFNKRIKTILKKKGIHEGEFRLQKFDYLCGENKKETTYKENGVNICLNVEKTYFSTRLSTERNELTKYLKKNEQELVMFSGVGPYAFVFLKNFPDIRRIVNIELNKDAHIYALKNLELNKNLAKKHEFYKNALKIFSEYKLLKGLKEKIFLTKLMRLILIFLNLDVKNSLEDLTIKEINSKNYIDLKKLNKLEKSKLLYDIIINDKSFNLKLENTIIEITNDFHKSLIIDFLQKNILYDKIFTLPKFENEIKNKNYLKFNNIFMPLPKSADEFLIYTVPYIKKDSIIHLYNFIHEKDFPDLVIEKINNFSNKNKIKYEIIEEKKVGQYSPKKYRVRISFKISQIE